MSFNNVPPPSGPPVDPNSAFADALKRAKEVVMLFRYCQRPFVPSLTGIFFIRSRHGWDQVALPRPRLRQSKV